MDVDASDRGDGGNDPQFTHYSEEQRIRDSIAAKTAIKPSDQYVPPSDLIGLVNKDLDRKPPMASIGQAHLYN